MKKYICMLCLLFCLCGCTKGGSHLFINQREKETSASWEMTYSKFKGFSQRKIEIQDVPLTMHCDIKNEDGTLLVKVSKDDKEVFSTKDSASYEFNEAGTYTLRVEGDDHKGGFEIDWGK